MALYGRSRDISLFRSVNRELIQDIIQTEIGYYKFYLPANNVDDLYGEEKSKVYYDPMKLACLINRSAQTYKNDNFGVDFDQNVEFRFLRDDLVQLNLVPESGDIILYAGNYYEIDSVIESQFIVGKYPDYQLTDYLQEFGNSLSILCNTHLSRITKLNLVGGYNY